MRFKSSYFIFLYFTSNVDSLLPLIVKEWIKRFEKDNKIFTMIVSRHKTFVFRKAQGLCQDNGYRYFMKHDESKLVYLSLFYCFIVYSYPERVRVSTE